MVLMKIIKQIFIGILNIILINLITIFVISLNIKTLTDGIFKETFKHQILNSIAQDDSKLISPNNYLNKMIESEEVSELIDKYLDITINGMLDERAIDKIEIEKDMLDYLQQNKSILEKALGSNLTNDMFKQAEAYLESKELSNILKQNLSNTSKNINEETKIILKVYNLLISLKFKIIILISILVDLILISIIQKSFYNWLKSFGISSIISGISLTIMALTVNLIISSLSEISNLHTNSILFSGFAVILLGSLSLIIKFLIDKNIKFKEKTNAVS